MKRLLASLLTITLLCGCAASSNAVTANTVSNAVQTADEISEEHAADETAAAEIEKPEISEVELPQYGWQSQVRFPD